jgi:hypothetical protein
MRRSILARVKFLSRLLTALNLLPSMATLAFASISIPGTVDWSARGSRFVPPLVNAVENMDDKRRAYVRNDAERKPVISGGDEFLDSTRRRESA